MRRTLVHTLGSVSVQLRSPPVYPHSRIFPAASFSCFHPSEYTRSWMGLACKFRLSCGLPVLSGSLPDLSRIRVLSPCLCRMPYSYPFGGVPALTGPYRYNKPDSGLSHLFCLPFRRCIVCQPHCAPYFSALLSVLPRLG